MISMFARFGARLIPGPLRCGPGFVISADQQGPCHPYRRLAWLGPSFSSSEVSATMASVVIMRPATGRSVLQGDTARRPSAGSIDAVTVQHARHIARSGRRSRRPCGTWFLQAFTLPTTIELLHARVLRDLAKIGASKRFEHRCLRRLTTSAFDAMLSLLIAALARNSATPPPGTMTFFELGRLRRNASVTHLLDAILLFLDLDLRSNCRRGSTATPPSKTLAMCSCSFSLS